MLICSVHQLSATSDAGSIGHVADAASVGAISNRKGIDRTIAFRSPSLYQGTQKDI
jgi:hypothetical protein